MVEQVLSFPAEAGHVIQNALIIQHSIERLVLVDEQPQAMQLIRAQTGVQVCYQHCCAVCLHTQMLRFILEIVWGQHVILNMIVVKLCPADYMFVSNHS
jgi:hypothetical protein